MPLEGMRIRGCQMEDLASVQEIEDNSFADPYPPALFLSFLKHFPKGFRIASLGDILLGYSVLVLEHKRAVIASLAVRKSYRRQHVGTSLLEDAIYFCKTQLGVKSIELQVRIDNKPAISLYSRLGFVAGNTIKNYYGEGWDGLSMSLVLGR